LLRYLKIATLLTEGNADGKAGKLTSLGEEIEKLGPKSQTQLMLQLRIASQNSHRNHTFSTPVTHFAGNNSSEHSISIHHHNVDIDNKFHLQSDHTSRTIHSN
jgi:hypothetical protein